MILTSHQSRCAPSEAICAFKFERSDYDKLTHRLRAHILLVSPLQMRVLLAVLVCSGAQYLVAGDSGTDAPAPPKMPERILSSSEWEFLLPTEKALVATYQNLTPEELKGLGPSERVSANARKGAAMAAAHAAAMREWCGKYPAECAQLAKAEARAEEAEEAEGARLAEERAARQQAQRQRDQQADRDQAGQLIDRVKTAVFMGRSRDAIKTEVFHSGTGGPETQQVKSQIESNLFMGNPALQGVHHP